MKKKILTLIVIVLLFGTGCTKYIKSEDKKVITYEKTGQNVTANILCKPTDKDLIKIYEENEKQLSVKLKNLPECKNFKINSLKYESLWESIFVKPLAFIILQVGKLVRNNGLAVMLVGLIIRILLLPVSLKTAKQSINMKKAQPEIKKIEKKYENKTDNASVMAKSQETMMVYKKYNMNPVSGCLMSFVQFPLFFAFLEAINRVPAIFEGNFASLNLGMTPWVGISTGQYLYIILIVLIVATTFLSFKNSMASGGGEAEKQMQFMLKFMIVFISIASLRLPTAIALYWIITNGFVVLQNYIVKRSTK